MIKIGKYRDTSLIFLRRVEDIGDVSPYFREEKGEIFETELQIN